MMPAQAYREPSGKTAQPASTQLHDLLSRRCCNGWSRPFRGARLENGQSPPRVVVVRMFQSRNMLPSGSKCRKIESGHDLEPSDYSPPRPRTVALSDDLAFALVGPNPAAFLVTQLHIHARLRPPQSASPRLRDACSHVCAESNTRPGNRAPHLNGRRKSCKKLLPQLPQISALVHACIWASD